MAKREERQAMGDKTKERWDNAEGKGDTKERREESGCEAGEREVRKETG